MNYYATCPDCGANLDPGEQCDCKKENALSAATDKTSKNKTFTKNSIAKNATICNKEIKK